MNYKESSKQDCRRDKLMPSKVSKASRDWKWTRITHQCFCSAKPPSPSVPLYSLQCTLQTSTSTPTRIISNSSSTKSKCRRSISIQLSCLLKQDSDSYSNTTQLANTPRPKMRNYSRRPKQCQCLYTLIPP